MSKLSGAREPFALYHPASDWASHNGEIKDKVRFYIKQLFWTFTTLVQLVAERHKINLQKSLLHIKIYT